MRFQLLLLTFFPSLSFKGLGIIKLCLQNFCQDHTEGKDENNLVEFGKEK